VKQELFDTANITGELYIDKKLNFKEFLFSFSFAVISPNSFSEFFCGLSGVFLIEKASL
jgi:hypothetical protein